MLGTLVHFDSGLTASHQKMIDLLRVEFCSQVVPAAIPSSLEIKGAGHTFTQLITDLKSHIDISVAYSIPTLHAIFAKVKSVPKQLLAKGQTHE